MKTLYRNNWIEIIFVKAVMIGAAYDDGAVILFLGPITFSFKAWMIDRKPKSFNQL
jgi:hypothetical protein